MKKILLLGNTTAERGVFNHFNEKAGFSVVQITSGDFTKEATYENQLNGVNIIVSFLGPEATDLAMEALFAVIYREQVSLELMIFLSLAGIDHEYKGQLQLDNLDELYKQQQYAIKVIDESEFPYTVLRLVSVSETKHGDVSEIQEGKEVPAGTISTASIIHFVIEAIENGKYKNQSVALVEEGK